MSHLPYRDSDGVMETGWEGRTTRASNGNHNSPYSALRHLHTRLICIRSGRGEEPLSLGVKEVDLDDLVPTLRQKYTALSYTWGESRKLVDVEIQCPNGCLHTLKITQSLFEALQHLRLPQESFYLWVDQLSIDQSNVAEREAQIGIMRIIYERAAAVTIWLGPGSPESDTACDCIVATHETFQKMWQEEPEWGPYQGGNHLRLEALKLALGTSQTHVDAWRAVVKLIQRKWFSRAWVVQEATSLDDSRTTFACGAKRMQAWVLHSLRDVFFAAELHDPIPRFEFLRQTSRIFTPILSILSFNIIRNRLPGGRPLLNLLWAIRSFDAADLRDKVFAMCGFASDLQPDEIRICYSPSVTAQETYRNFALWYLKKHGSLDLLAHAGLAQRSPSSSLLPSWVPDWSFQSIVTPLAALRDPDVATSAPIYTASGPRKRLNMTQPTTVPQDIQALRLMGARIATIGERLESLADLKVSDLLSDELEDQLAARRDKVFLPYSPAKKSRIAIRELLIRTVFGDCNRVPLQGIGWISERMWESTDTERIVKILNPFQLRRTISGRSLFLSLAQDRIDPHSLLCLGPDAAAPGDEIWLLKGGQVFYILRPVKLDLKPSVHESSLWLSDKPMASQVVRSIPVPRYHLVGETYLQGFMDGEILARMGDKPVLTRPAALWQMDKDFGELCLE